MGKYTDDDIRNCKKVTCQIAASYLGISSMAIMLGMRNSLLPIGFAVKNEERYHVSWRYHIIELENEAQDYQKACQIRAYAKAVLDTYGSDEMDAKTAAWGAWAMKKADWFDPTVARDDELFGEREHEKNATEKALKKYGQYW